jgi:ABC-type transporter MlaC component
MKSLVFAFALAIAAVTPASADEVMQSMRSDADCTDLVRQAQAGLQSNTLHDLVRERLQQMLDTGRSGNLLACQDVANGSLASPKPEASSCEKPAV